MSVTSVMSDAKALTLEVRVVMQDLISQLLIRDPAKRLGSRAGAEEIKAHPFFKGINWALLRNTVPPYVPRVSASDRPQPPAAAQAVFEAF